MTETIREASPDRSGDPLMRRWTSALVALRELDFVEASVAATRLRQTGCYLVPFTAGDCTTENAKMLAAWRDAHQYAYPTRFAVTEAGTRKWLQSLLGDSSRVMFWVRKGDGRAVGHIGLKLHEHRGAVEIDNVLRGAEGAVGAFSEAMAALSAIAFHELGLGALELRVLKSNDRAIRFYERLGWRATDEVPLVARVDGNRVDYVPAEDGDSSQVADWFVTMELGKGDLAAQESGVILTAGPRITAAERCTVYRAVDGAWNEGAGSFVAELEATFAALIGRRHAIATSSCTGALHLALAGLGIGPGDEVIVPNVTWVATASAVAYVGATPVFADVNDGTWTLDPACVREAVTPRTRAVLPVHLYGYPADVASIRDAVGPNVRIVEDAAPAIGARHADGRVVGSLGDVAAFSFQGAKLVVGGEGGMLVTDDDDLAAEIRGLANHGRIAHGFEIGRLGFKYKMNDVTAALVLGQLTHLEQMIERKEEIHAAYRTRLESVHGLRVQEAPAPARSIHWMNSVCLGVGHPPRAAVIDRLKSARVDTRPVFPLLSSFPMWDSDAETPVAAELATRAINLPSGVNLTDVTIAYVVESLMSAING